MRAVRPNNPTAVKVFTGGSGLYGKEAGGAITDTGTTTWGGDPSLQDHRLGTKGSVADGERAGIANALQLHPHAQELTIQTDSTTALTSTMNLAKGHPPHSRIEMVIGNLLHRRHTAGYKTNIYWVKNHIGIPGNEAAGRYVGEPSSDGKGSPVTTSEGIRAWAKRRARKLRVQLEKGTGPIGTSGGTSP